MNKVYVEMTQEEYLEYIKGISVEKAIEKIIEHKDMHCYRSIGFNPKMTCETRTTRYYGFIGDLEITITKEEKIDGNKRNI